MNANVVPSVGAPDVTTHATKTEGHRHAQPHGHRSQRPRLANHRISIKAPRELVWKLHTDISAWPTWQTDIKEAVLEGKLEAGNSFRWTTFGMTITSTVYALEAGSRILWGGKCGRHRRHP
jgi:uncharacterized membrane protein